MRACVRACVLRRSAIGLPGGIKNEAVSVLQDAAAKKGMKVLAGKGDEDDTLRARSIYVYDTEEFPFYAGELYHQYHNDMVSECVPLKHVKGRPTLLIPLCCEDPCQISRALAVAVSAECSAGELVWWS
jgi:hypothetical protein